MNKPPVEPRFKCTNLHTGETHSLTQDEVGELLETGVAPTPPDNWDKPAPDIVIHDSPTFRRDMFRSSKEPVTFTNSKGETHTSSIPVIVTKESLVMLEKLPRAKVVIRPDENGIDINYGPLVAGNLDGIPFVAEDWYLDMLKVPYVIMDKIPEFLPDFKLDVELSVESGRKIIVHILDKSDIRQLAVAFSKVGGGRWVGVNHKCRWLETFENGHVVNGHQTIDEFYTGMTAEQIEHSKY